MGKLCVVLDTNVLASGFVYPLSIPGKVLNAWLEEQIELALSLYILEEWRRILPKFKYRPTEDESDILMQRFLQSAQIFHPTNFYDAELRDENDQQILGTLIAAKADYLITGDKDLLALKSKYPICTPREFWARHGE